MGKITQKIDFWLSKLGTIFLFILIIYLPLSELALHALQSYSHLPDSLIFWLTHFYEPIIVLFFLVYLIKFALGRKLPKLEKIDLYAIAFLLLALVMVLFHHSDLQRGLQGLRFLILPYAVFLLARFIDFKNSHRLVQFYLFIAAIISVLAVIEYFFLPHGYMDIYYGISGFGFGENSLISTTQAQSIFASPNQLASYLILPFFYLLHRYFIAKKTPLATWDSYLLILVTLAIGLTFSRSAMLGVFVGTVLVFLYFGRGRRDKIVHAILFIVITATLAVEFALQNGELPRDLITHGASMVGHQQATIDSFRSLFTGGFWKVLFGFGVGSAGPLALKLGGIVSENYYLQICFELGLAGLAIYILFIINLLTNIFQASKTTFFTLIALLVNAFFLHIFSDNPAMAVSIFIVVATVINLEAKGEGSV